MPPEHELLLLTTVLDCIYGGNMYAYVYVMHYIWCRRDQKLMSRSLSRSVDQVTRWLNNVILTLASTACSFRYYTLCVFVLYECGNVSCSWPIYFWSLHDPCHFHLIIFFFGLQQNVVTLWEKIHSLPSYLLLHICDPFSYANVSVGMYFEAVLLEGWLFSK